MHCVRSDTPGCVRRSPGVLLDRLANNLDFDYPTPAEPLPGYLDSLDRFAFLPAAKVVAFRVGIWDLSSNFAEELWDLDGMLVHRRYTICFP